MRAFGNEVFVDTGGWFSLMTADDPDHSAFVSEVRARVESGSRLVTTNLVAAETHALLLRRGHHRVALAFLREVRRSPNLIAYSDAEIEARAERDWIERFDDQSFSLTDAVSFTVMAERGITDALARDRHFATAGFTMVPTRR